MKSIFVTIGRVLNIGSLIVIVWVDGYYQTIILYAKRNACFFLLSYFDSLLSIFILQVHLLPGIYLHVVVVKFK